MTDKDKIAAKIRALRAKTVENGCTEAEALAAADLVAKLLAEYNLTVDEVEMRASPFTKHREVHDDAVGERLWKVADGIAHMTGVRYWVGRPGERHQINFFGFEHEVDVARYLLEVCARAMRTEQRRQERAFALLVASRRRQKVLPFLDGMADRLRERIRAMKPPAPTGKGLVVLRGALMTDAMKKAGINLEQGSARASHDHEESYYDGRAAGDRVALNQGLSGATAAVRGLLQ